MFERFTDRARQAVAYAQDEARTLGHNYAGTEHLLLGLLRPPSVAFAHLPGVARQALLSFGIDYERVREQVVDIVGEGGGSSDSHIPFTSKAKTAIELSLREALQLGHNYIGSEHLLLGMIREGEGVAMQVTVRLGINPSSLRQRVMEILTGVSPATAKQSSSLTDARTDTGTIVLVADGYTPEFKGVLQKAVQLAADEGRPVDTRHLAAALASYSALRPDG